MPNILVNGRIMEVEEGTTLDGLLDLLGISRAGIAVEVNREIVPKARLKETVLDNGDSVEMVRMAGGG
jgi:sulfur carrier protein